MKPDEGVVTFVYSHGDVGFTRYDSALLNNQKIFNLKNITDAHEVFSFSSPSRSLALGATAVSGGAFNQPRLGADGKPVVPNNGQENLNGFNPQNPQDPINFGADHSGQFEDDNMLRKYYWRDAMKAFGLTPISDGTQGIITPVFGG
jgi:hypothetical protein